MKLTDKMLHERFDDMLDECYPEVKIANLTYFTSSALKSVDKIAYNESFNNWLDSEVKAGLLFEYDDEYYTDETDLPLSEE